tara:strand:- start:2336 stop:3154 length:819 start_codon:yes stop_codon:yes gene_type:complete
MRKFLLILLTGLMFSNCKEGCTDPKSFNYDPEAWVDDNNCIPIIIGCMDSTAYNYNPKANTMSDYTQCIYKANIENCNEYLEGRVVYIDNYKSIDYKLKFIYNLSNELLPKYNFRSYFWKMFDYTGKAKIKLDTLVYIPEESELGNLSSIVLPTGENIKVIVESKGVKKNYFIDIVFETKEDLYGKIVNKEESESESIYLINPLRKNKYKLEIFEYSTIAVSKNYNNEIKSFKAFFNKIHKIDYWFKDPPKEIEIETFMGFGHEKKYQLKRY